MSLVTPDFGLLFWMVLIFGIVFFLLAKFGFPMITSMVDRRNEHIRQALTKAEEAETRMARLAEEQQALIADTRRQQSQILREATEAKAQIIAAAETEAAGKAQRLLDKARTEIAAEKESALREIRREVARLSVDVAEKVIRRELSSDQAQLQYLDRLVDEIGRDNPS